MNTVKCTNRLCEKEYNVEFDNCPFCGAANPMEENERHALIAKRHNDTELKPELTNSEKLSGWVTGIIWLNILFGSIRGIINSVTVMMYSPVWGAVDLGLQIIGIISLAFLLLAKKWALYLWVGYLIAVSIINGYLNNNEYATFAIVAAIKLVLMFLFLQIKKDGVSAWSLIFNKKKVNATNDDVNAPQDTEEHIESKASLVGNSNDGNTIKTEAEENKDIETHNNVNAAPNESYLSTENGTIQIEENIKLTEEDPANETPDSTPLVTKLDGSKKVKNGKWWIYPLIIVVTLAIVWVVLWISLRPSEPELGKYVYVDAYDILHVKLNCNNIADVHGTKPVTIYALYELTRGKWKQICSCCISDCLYEKIELLVIENDNLKLLYKSLIADGYNLPLTYEEFEEDMHDINNLKRIYTNLTKEGYLLPNYDSFVIDMGLNSEHKPSCIVRYQKSRQREIYDAISKVYDIGTFEFFAEAVKDEKRRVKLYNGIKGSIPDIPNYDDFTKDVLNDGTPGSEQLFE